ncbi:deoxyribodipyrimidine photo-lyase [Streptomyces sp. NPDC005438]|uniref:cryptochrome/photolyase family protein n=1 Tax=Streptomyces sp. NPDC005438 TaxID=3156880 RepID=UPI00339F9627
MTSTSVVLFTSDLRLTDHPPLVAALDAAEEVVPLFVRDTDLESTGFACANRRAFLADCLHDLDRGLRERGGRLVVRRGPVVDEVVDVVRAVDAGSVHLAAGGSGYALARERRLRERLEPLGCALRVHESVQTVVPPGEVTPQGRDHYAVFTPYWRKWRSVRVRDPLPAPKSVTVPTVRGTKPPARERSGVSAGLAEGGERAGRKLWDAWRKGGVDDYDRLQDDLARDGTSRLSPYLHFGALSPVELATAAGQREGAGPEAFVRQLAWRDFHHQVLAARPECSWSDYRSRGDRWRLDSGEVEAWRQGRTGFPLVDAAMRQLLHEGWIHNRARMLVASFLTKTLYVDWRVGARHFLDWLVDGDVANNQMNWQWVAGTGTDTRPNRVLNPLTQARRFDPDGAYVRAWVPELAGVEGSAVHRPWRLPGKERAALDYPEPLVDLDSGRARFERARGLN